MTVNTSTSNYIRNIMKIDSKYIVRIFSVFCFIVFLYYYDDNPDSKFTKISMMIFVFCVISYQLIIYFHKRREK